MIVSGLLVLLAILVAFANGANDNFKGVATLQGLAANLVTAALVTLASTLGLPVSTTHVSCGALAGIGFVRGDLRWATIRQILGAWLTTLPVAAALAAAAALVTPLLR